MFANSLIFSLASSIAVELLFKLLKKKNNISGGNLKMAANGIIALAAALAIAISTLGPGIGQGIASAKAMEAIARQPEAAGTVRSTLILALGLMEALTIYGLLISFMLLSKMG